MSWYKVMRIIRNRNLSEASLAKEKRKEKKIDQEKTSVAISNRQLIAILTRWIK